MQPDWVLNTPVEKGALYGVGSAEVFGGNEAGAVARAKDMGRAELIKQIKVNITAEVDQEITEIVKNGASDLTKNLRKAVRSQVPEFKLSNVTQSDAYRSKSHVSVMVRLDVTKELSILRRKIADLDEQIEEYKQKFEKNDPQGLSAVRIISPVLVLVEHRGEIQSQYNALSQTAGALVPAEIRDFIAQLYQRVAQMSVTIEAKEDEDSSIRTGLIASLTKNGMRISESGQSDMTIVYKLDINNVKQSGSFYSITSGEIWIKDEVGKVVKAFQTKAKGVSGNEKEAKSRSIKKLSNKLGQEMMAALF